MSENREDKEKGFAAFNSMVSDIDKDLAVLGNMAKSPDPISPAAPAIPPPVSTSRPEKLAPKQESSVYSAPPRKKGGSGKLWAWGIGIGIVIWLANSGNNSTKPFPTQSNSAPLSSSNKPSLPNTTATPAYVPSPPAWSPPPGPYEEKPPEGSGLYLNNAQIRYCLSEEIRLDAVEKIANTSKSGEVSAFNARVGDYNSRCSHFKYRRGSLEEVRAELEVERNAIKAAAQSSWVRKSLGLESEKQSLKELHHDDDISRKNASYKRKPTVTGLSENKNTIHPPPMRFNECKADSECGTGLYCVFGKCRSLVKQGGACERNTECAGLKSFCSSGFKCIGGPED